MWILVLDRMGSNLRSADLLAVTLCLSFSHLQVGHNNSNYLIGRLGGLNVSSVVPDALEGSISVKYH